MYRTVCIAPPRQVRLTFEQFRAGLERIKRTQRLDIYSGGESLEKMECVGMASNTSDNIPLRAARSREQIVNQMRRIRKVDTKPELVVRRLAHTLGYRYRLHRRDLPGTPDLVFPSKRKVVLVHGCFWHQHHCPLGSKQPRVNTHYWLPKLARNKERDLATICALEELGWSVLVVWECETRNDSSLRKRLRTFLQ